MPRRARPAEPAAAPVVVLDSSSLPPGELLAGADRPVVRDRAARRLAVVALAVLVGGLLQASDLRREEAVERELGDRLAVAGTVTTAAVSTVVAFTSSGSASTTSRISTVELAVSVRNTSPRAVRLRRPALVPAAAGVVPELVPAADLDEALRGAARSAVPDSLPVPPDGTGAVVLRFAPDCALVDELARTRVLEVAAVSATGRTSLVSVPVGDDLGRLGRDACRRTPIAESLVLTASDVQLAGGRLQFDLGFARDTLLGGTLVGVTVRGLRVGTAGLPRLLPLVGRDEPAVVPVVAEIGSCKELQLNPRGFLLTLQLQVADGSGVRSTVVSGIGDGSEPLNRLAAGLISRGCGFDPLFRTA